MSMPTPPLTYQAVLFDLDGTLCDTALDFTLAINRLLSEHQRPSLTLSQVREQVSNGAMAVIQLAFADIEDSDQLKQLRLTLIDYYQQHMLQHTQLYPGMAALLHNLQQRQIPWGVVSNKPEALTKAIVAHLTTATPASCLIGGDTLAVAKPHPEPLQLAAQQCGVDCRHCVYIGDHHRDIIAAKAAGMTAIGATFGYLTLADNPHLWGADYLADTPAQLIQHLGLATVS